MHDMIILDEATEVIALPEFDASVARGQEDPNSIEIWNSYANT